MADLKEILERLDYCEAEIIATRAACRSYISAAFEWRGLEIVGSTLVQVRMTMPLPTSIKSRTGTTIHEIRSCLDALACQLAIRNGKTPSSTYFPISKNAQTFGTDGLQKIKKLSQADQETIVFMQPHGEADPFLFGMHEFDRVRKHRRLGVTLPENTGIGFGDCEITSLLFHGIGELTEQWSTAFTMGGGSWATFSFNNQIVFTEPNNLKGLNILTGMERFAAHVRGVVGAFQ